MIIYNNNDLKNAKNDQITYNNYINNLDTSILDKFINDLIPRKNIKNNLKSLLNKCTDDNYQLIKDDILLILDQGKDTTENLLNIITEICIDQHNYIENPRLWSNHKIKHAEIWGTLVVLYIGLRERVQGSTIK